MSQREQIRQLILRLGQQLGMEIHLAASAPRQKLPSSEHAVADIEWRLPLAGRVEVSLIRRLLPEFPESLPLAGFVITESGERAPQYFFQLAMLEAARYPLGLLITDSAAAYRRGHRSLRSFRQLLGSGRSWVADVQQLSALLKRLEREPPSGTEVSGDPLFALPLGPGACGAPSKSKNWAGQVKELLWQLGRQSRLQVIEDACPIDFTRYHENSVEAFATVQRYLQMVLLEEIGHALGHYHSYTPLKNRPPRDTTVWNQQYEPARVDVVWRLPLPAGLRRFCRGLMDMDAAFHYAVPLLNGGLDHLALVGFNLERSMNPAAAGRMLMLGNGCHWGFLITSPAQLPGAQQALALVGRAAGMANVRALSRDEVLALRT